MLLKNQIALITGSGRGIGRAIAHLFAKEGAAVFLVARTEKELSATAAEIMQAADARNFLPGTSRTNPIAGRLSMARWLRSATWTFL